MTMTEIDRAVALCLMFLSFQCVHTSS